MSDPSNNDASKTAERAHRQSETPGGQAITPMRAEDHSNARPAAETPVEGRQGFLGRPVLAVLIDGLLLVGLAWIIVHYATR